MVEMVKLGSFNLSIPVKTKLKTMMSSAARPRGWRATGP
jgi:hypothetical protein